ncbi:hypothetical protein BGC07_10835 [Piscirickettsia litoralis]|uniref:Rod shape-determining protein MreD n=2 Tax=Piscirickettsia litoralis TaxID=1891921 RepID=A0ABX3A517_9GAMM|nr:hypothetical protein BGC07_10835 [Piscirickettsia litoralis]
MTWLGIFALTISIMCIKLTLPSQSFSDQPMQQAYYAIFSTLPFHTFASIVGLAVSCLVNDYILSKSKVAFSGKAFALRSLIITFIGEFIYQIVAYSIAWLHTFTSPKHFILFFFVCFAYKIIFYLFLLPTSSFTVHTIKRITNIDIYDESTKFAPLRFKIL